MRNGGDIIKGIFIIIVLVFLVGQVSAYTPEQKMTIEGMNLSYQLGTAHEKAIQGQNVTEFNNLVDIYNAWIKQHFAGEGTVALLMSKITATNLPGIVQKQQVPAGSTVLTKTFNASSDLSKFGKQRVRSPLTAPEEMESLEDTITEQKMKNL